MDERADFVLNRPPDPNGGGDMRQLSLLVVALSLLVARSPANALPPPDVLVAQPLIYAGKAATAGIMAVYFLGDVVLGAPVACVAQMIGDGALEGCSAGANKASKGSTLAVCHGLEVFSEALASTPCANAGFAPPPDSTATPPLTP
jgi:hypothetical protein